MKSIPNREKFVDRHIGPREDDINEMLEAIGVNSIDEMINETVPDNILLNKKLNLKNALTETELLDDLQKISSKNKIFKNLAIIS